MKKEKIQNPKILAAIASLGHTDFLCIADCGLPIPRNVKVIDVSVSAGIPDFISVLKAVSSELVIESVICASEIDEINPKMMREIQNILDEIPVRKVDHSKFKELTALSKAIIRTGETSPYANIILVGGVNF
jgi:D-ribose pyranase